jgi:integrase
MCAEKRKHFNQLHDIIFQRCITIQTSVYSPPCVPHRRKGRAMRMKLTDAALKKYQPKTPRDEIFDKEVKGFGVRVTTAGKTFFFIRRVRSAKVRFSLGQYPMTSLADARKQAFAIVDKIKKGGDPRPDYSVRKRAEGEPDTFAHVAKRFIAEYCEGKKTPLSKNTIAAYKLALQGERTAKWASRPLADITDRDIIRVIDKMEAEKRFASAMLFRAYLSKFFNWCIGKRLIRENPTRGISISSTPSDFERDRCLKIPELQAVLGAADRLREPLRAYVFMLILTGQRRTETALMKWSDLTLEGDKPVWAIPAENTKNGMSHEVALSPEAVAVLSRLPKISDHVFTTNGKTPISDYSKIKAAIDKALVEANIAPWRIHDLRRSVSTGLGELGFPPHVIEMVLNHVSGTKAGVSGTYNRSRYGDDCRRALAAWAQAVTAKHAGGNIVALRPGG